jgi:hypothetical protein
VRSETVGYFSGDRLIEFRQLPWDSFAHQLCAEYRASVGTGPPATVAEPGSGAPKAFLCYAAEDRETVEAIGEVLQARGVAIWRDKQDLRTGENWDRVLVDVISKRVDYFVVVQSSNMANRIEGYFRKEIEVALDRFSKFDKSFLFVLPVTLRGGILLPEFENLHVDIDVTTEAGIERLAKTILDDWSKPKRRSPVALSMA